MIKKQDIVVSAKQKIERKTIKSRSAPSTVIQSISIDNVENPPVITIDTEIQKTSTISSSQSFLPIPSYRQRSQCPFEIKRNRLAKSGRDLQREILCPLGI
jgi:hypothetical protein